MCDGHNGLMIRDATDPRGFSVVPFLDESTLFDIRYGTGKTERTSVSLVRFDTPKGKLARLFVRSEWDLSDKPVRLWMYPYDAVPVRRVIAFMREHPKALGNALSRRKASDVIDLLCHADGRPGQDEETRREFLGLLEELGVDFATVDTDISQRTASDRSWGLLMRLEHEDAGIGEDS